MTPALQRNLKPDSGPAPARTRGGKILVVDDEPPMRRFIELGLQAGGYREVIFCNSGSNVPAVAMSERPQLIIMDVMMPGGNGMRALRMLKHSPATASIPVIITSGFAIPTLDEQQNRADHLLPKPFSTQQLLDVVGHLIKE